MPIVYVCTIDVCQHMQSSGTTIRDASIHMAYCGAVFPIRTPYAINGWMAFMLFSSHGSAMLVNYGGEHTARQLKCRLAILLSFVA